MSSGMEQYGNITIIEADSRFKKVDKGLIENPNIDCLTLGIYTKLIVLGKKWQLNVKGLRKHLGLSDDKVRKSLSLLEQEGYILRTPARNAKGQLVGWNYTIYPTPINEENRSQAGLKNNDNRLHETPSTPKSDHTANRGLLNDRLNQSLDLNEFIDLKEEDKVISDWRTDFNAYLKLVNEAKVKLLADTAVRAKKEKYYPDIDYELSLEKMVEDFWGTEEGWKHKVKSSKKTKEIDMAKTLAKAFDLSGNRVYKKIQKKGCYAGGTTPKTIEGISDLPDGLNADGTFNKNRFRYYHSLRDNIDYSIPPSAPPMPSFECEWNPLTKEWYYPKEDNGTYGELW